MRKARQGGATPEKGVASGKLLFIAGLAPKQSIVARNILAPKVLLLLALLQYTTIATT
jgi:hypothetical protein